MFAQPQTFCSIGWGPSAPPAAPCGKDREIVMHGAATSLSSGPRAPPLFDKLPQPPPSSRHSQEGAAEPSATVAAAHASCQRTSTRAPPAGKLRPQRHADDSPQPLKGRASRAPHPNLGLTTRKAKAAPTILKTRPRLRPLHAPDLAHSRTSRGLSPASGPWTRHACQFSLIRPAPPADGAQPPTTHNWQL